jgi:hypothetical protein
VILFILLVYTSTTLRHVYDQSKQVICRHYKGCEAFKVHESICHLFIVNDAPVSQSIAELAAHVIARRVSSVITIKLICLTRSSKLRRRLRHAEREHCRITRIPRAMMTH